ncbi:C40 family peptidase [Myroides odoratimimus subsp. xuanwuensis]
MLHGRKRLISALTGITALIAVGLVPASPSYAEPDLATVKERVDKLYHEAEQASERYNDAKIELAELTKDLDSLEADEKRQSTTLEGVRSQVEDSVVRQYQGEAISTVGEVVVSDDPKSFLAQLSTMSTFNDMQTSLFDDYSTELEALDIRREATEERAADIAAAKKRLGKEKTTIDTKLEAAEELLDELEADERERMTASSRSETRLPVDVPASGRAGAAIQYAMAQVGDSYVYGAAGPSAFDCSGLTMMAWAQAGVGLPHSSSAQSASGTRVSSDALQPGDLVFYYSPISHVGLYIGNGQIVHAANPSTGVAVSGVFSMPYSGAVRPG